jgi:hypothetical protein
MLRPTHTLALIAALAVSVIAAPSALARPDFVPPSAEHRTAGPSQRLQDLRRLNAANDVRTSPSPARQSTHAVGTDDGTPWTAIILGLAGACVLIASLALARRARPRPVPAPRT